MKEISVKSILNKKKNRDSWFLDDYTLNPYEGCSINCQYCYIRGSKYGENMADTLSAKINGVEVLDRQLAFRAKKNQYGIIALASATDPYIKAEEKYQLTQRFLLTILRHRFPVLIITKSDGILRDIELLREIDRQAIHADDLKGKISRGAIVSFSFSTLDAEIAATLEPGALLPQQRLELMKKCSDAGLFVGMNCIPVLPFISDSEERLSELIHAGKEHGADYVLIGGLTLFGSTAADSKVLYQKFLERRFPHLISEYKKLYRVFPSPSPDYIVQLNERAKRLCNQVGLRRGILPNTV
jgi:DNA repair photolyase